MAALELDDAPVAGGRRLGHAAAAAGGVDATGVHRVPRRLIASSRAANWRPSQHTRLVPSFLTGFPSTVGHLSISITTSFITWLPPWRFIRF